MDEVALFATLIVLHGGQVKAQGVAQTLCEEHQVTDVGQLYRKLTSSMELV
jgi:hypothetical protein